VLSYAEDGSRIGQPARELMVYEMMDPARRLSLVLPNQDHHHHHHQVQDLRAAMS